MITHSADALLTSVRSSSNGSKMLKVMGIWEERRIVDSSVLNELRGRITGEAPSHPSTVASAGLPPSARPSSIDPLVEEEEGVAGAVAAASGRDARSPGAPARSVPLAELLVSLEQGSLVDELSAEREADLDLGGLGAKPTDPAHAAALAAKVCQRC